MGFDLGKTFADAAKRVSDSLGKTGKDITKAIDQNGDGKLDFSDIQVISNKIQADRAEAQRKADLEKLKPLFPDNFEGAEFVMPKMLRVAEIDKLHAENPVCKDSVGFKTVQNDMTAVTIYPGFVEKLGLSFYPELENGVYYVDPSDRDQYIMLDDYYFSYMKMQRVAELQRIAQSLGAKHFRVTYKERSKSLSSNSVAASAGLKSGTVKADAKASHTETDSSMSAISIEAELSFPGHDPIKPELHYLKKEINVINLIDMRMDPLSPLQHQRFNIELSNSIGIKRTDAVKIDTMLKTMKMTGNTTVESEVQNEERRILEYEIDF